MQAMPAASVGVKAPTRMPPRITTGASRPQKASLKLCQMPGRSSSPDLPPKSFSHEMTRIGTMIARPARMPGNMPAAKIAGTETPGTVTA